jgi:predicted nucleic acid-binding protein
MTLVDSSVLIDFFSKRPPTDQTAALKRLLRSREEICVCGIILTEILQGIRSDREFRIVRDLLSDFTSLPIADATFRAAAELYRALRKKGVTIRKTNDCIIAAVAIEHRVPLLHSDRDFELIAAHSPLKVFP